MAFRLPWAHPITLLLAICFRRLFAESTSGCPDRRTSDGLACLFGKVYPGYGIVDFKDESLGKIGVYGELKPAGVKKILDFTGLGQEDVFYDLGCGTGKIVLQVALEAEPKKCIGAELAHARVQLANDALTSLQQLEPSVANMVQFHEGDFFKLDLSDATVIFTASLVFPVDVLRNLEAVVTELPPGTMIISLRQFDGCHPGLVQNRVTLQLAATWGAGVGYVYVVALRWKPPVDLYGYKLAERAAKKELERWEWPIVDEPLNMGELQKLTQSDARSKRLLEGKGSMKYDDVFNSVMHRARGQFSSALQCLWEEIYANSRTMADDLSYNELFEVEIATVLETCAKDCTFADLGSGKGKAVLQAGVSGLVGHAIGIELESARHKVAQEALQSLDAMGLHHAPVEFREGDLISLMQGVSPHVLLLNVPLSSDQKRLLGVWIRTLRPGTVVFSIEEWTEQEANAAHMKVAERTLRLHQFQVMSGASDAAKDMGNKEL